MIVDKPLRRPTPTPLEDGQLYRVAGGNLKVVMLGKLLVHYKLGKIDAPRVPTSIASISTLQKYIRKNKAVLIQA